MGKKSERLGKEVMVSFAQLWREINSLRRAPDSEAHWDERSLTYAKGTNDAYATDFIEKMKLAKPSLVLDMGCGTGLLAIPLALQGHGVIAADFSEGMLERLHETAYAVGVPVLNEIPQNTLNGKQGGFIVPKKMSWEDDWKSFGLYDNMVEVALASRSIITRDLADSLRKLSQVASERVFVTADLGISPRVNTAAAKAMGITLEKFNTAAFVFGIAQELGYEPEVSYIHSSRMRVYASRDEAYHSLLKTLDYVDKTIAQPDSETVKQRLRDWLLVHLVQRDKEKMWQLDAPQVVPWAFFSWSV